MKSTVELWTTFAERQQALYPRLHRLMSRWEDFFPLDYGQKFKESLGDYQRSRIDWEDFTIEDEEVLASYTERVKEVEEALVMEANFIAFRTLAGWMVEENSPFLDEQMYNLEAEYVNLDLDLETIIKWTNSPEPVRKWALTEATAPLEWHLVYMIAWWFDNPKGLEDWMENPKLSPYQRLSLDYGRLAPTPEWVFSDNTEDIPFPKWMRQMRDTINDRKQDWETSGDRIEVFFPPLAL